VGGEHSAWDSAGGYAVGMREPQIIQIKLAPAGTLAACMEEWGAMLLDRWQSQGWGEPGDNL